MKYNLYFTLKVKALMEKIFLYIPRDAFGDNVSHICLKSKSNHPEKLLISLAIYKWGIFCQKLFRVFKIKLPKATGYNVAQESEDNEV